MKKFLLIRLSALGDIIHSLPAAVVLQKNFPDSQIDWVVSDKFENLVKNNPYVDNVYVMPLSKWRKSWLSPKTWTEIYKFTEALRKENYDIALDLHGMFKSAVILAFCGAKRRITYKDAREGSIFAANEYVKPKSKRPHRNYHVTERHFDMLRHLRIEIDSEHFFDNMAALLPDCSEKEKKHVDLLLEDFDYSKPLIAIAPATTWVNKHWREENWREVILTCQNFANIILTGSNADTKLLERIGKGSKAQILAGKTSLNELAEVFRRCDIVISPDSGSAHLAWAVCRPSVITIFCATSSKTFAPRGSKHFAFPENPVCMPCHKRKCRLKKCVCTDFVEPEEVIEKVKKILKLKKSPLV